MKYAVWVSISNTTEITILDAYKVLINTYKFLTYPSTTNPPNSMSTYLFTQLHMHIPSLAGSMGEKCTITLLASPYSPISKSSLAMWAWVFVQLIHMLVTTFPAGSHTQSWEVGPSRCASSCWSSARSALRMGWQLLAVSGGEEAVGAQKLYRLLLWSCLPSPRFLLTITNSHAAFQANFSRNSLSNLIPWLLFNLGDHCFKQALLLLMSS